jgi:uncharacterized membrane protein
MPRSENSEVQVKFIVVPVLTLNRKPGTSRFRRTLSVSLIFVPVASDWIGPAKASAEDLRNCFWSRGFTLSGPLTKFVQAVNNGTLEDILTGIIKRIVSSLVKDSEIGKAWSAAFSQISYSRQFTLDVLAETIDADTIIAFLGRGSSLSAQLVEELNSLVAPLDRLAIDGDNAMPSSVDYKSLCVNDAFGIDARHLDFYNPRESKLVGIMNSRWEGTRSIKWLFAWHLYMSLGLSSFESMNYHVYRKLETERGLEALIHVESELAEEIDEYYDLEIGVPIYKNAYERLKRVAGIEEDYDRLKKKIESFKTNVVIKDQRDLTGILILLTGIILAASVYQITMNSLFSLIIVGAAIAVIVIHFRNFARKRMKL